VTPTDHAVNGAEEHGALGGRGALAEVLQHQRAVAEDVHELPQVEHPDLLQVLPLLVRGGRAAHRKEGGGGDIRSVVKGQVIIITEA